jgi:hypothetical protein
MGEIILPVKVCHRNSKSRCLVVRAVVDSGATLTVTSEGVAAKLGLEQMDWRPPLEGVRRTTYGARLQLGAKGCRSIFRAVVADDALMQRAGQDVGMILGQNYLQQARARLEFGPGPDEDGAWCARGPRRPRTGKSCPR